LCKLFDFGCSISLDDDGYCGNAGVSGWWLLKHFHRIKSVINSFTLISFFLGHCSLLCTRNTARSWAFVLRGYFLICHHHVAAQRKTYSIWQHKQERDHHMERCKAQFKAGFIDEQFRRWIKFHQKPLP
jgi:hypothetical protein